MSVLPLTLFISLHPLPPSSTLTPHVHTHRLAASAWRAVSSSLTAPTCCSSCTRRLTGRGRRSSRAPASRCSACRGGRGGEVTVRELARRRQGGEGKPSTWWRWSNQSNPHPPITLPDSVCLAAAAAAITIAAADWHHQARHRSGLFLQSHPQRRARGRPAAPRGLRWCAAAPPRWVGMGRGARYAGNCFFQGLMVR